MLRKIKRKFLLARFRHYGRLFDKYHAKAESYIGILHTDKFWHWSEKSRRCLNKRNSILSKLYW